MGPVKAHRHHHSHAETCRRAAAEKEAVSEEHKPPSDGNDSESCRGDHGRGQRHAAQIEASQGAARDRRQAAAEPCDCAASQVVAPEHIYVVVGHEAERVRAAVAATGMQFVEQTEQRGTGHAIQCARQAIAGYENILVLSGDVPLIRAETIDAAVGISPSRARRHDAAHRRARRSNRLRPHRAQGAGLARSRSHRRAEVAHARPAEDCARSTPASTHSGPRRCSRIWTS